MSAFERMPREIRDMIYKCCLLYDGEIVPFPRDYEREDQEGRSRLENSAGNGSVLPKIPMQKNDRHAFFGYPKVKREALQAANTPCVALLGVNSTIQDEAATILFGKNIWRLSYMPFVQDERYRLWETYTQYFRQVVTNFNARDIDGTELLDLEMSSIYRFEEDTEDSDYFDQIPSFIHSEQLELLRSGFIARRDILRQMNLKSLSFDFSKLTCPYGCCRHKALQICLKCMGPIEPWYILERERVGDIGRKLETDVGVFGLNDDNEKELFLETWGLVVD